MKIRNPKSEIRNVAAAVCLLCSVVCLPAFGQVLVGPLGSTTNSIPRFADATGKRVTNSVAHIDASGNFFLTTTTGTIQIPPLTTAQRDAMSATNGMAIYNTTISNFQFRVSGAWLDLGTGGIGGTNFVDLTSVQSIGGVKQFTNYVEFGEATLPGTPATNVGRMFFLDQGGLSRPYAKDDAGNLLPLSEMALINVEQHPYNATGGDATDDTVALQAAFDAASVAGSKVAIFMPGVYNFTNTLAISNQYGLTIFGTGARRSKLNVTAPIAGPALKIFNCQNFKIENLAVWANNLADYALLLDSDNVVPTSNGKIELCEFICALKDGVRLGTSLVNNYQIDHITLQNSFLTGSKTNLTLESGNALENVLIACQLGASATNIPSHNISILNGGLRVVSSSFFHSTNFDIRLGTGAKLNVYGGNSESDRVLTTDFSGASENPVTFSDFEHNVTYAGTSWVWDRAGRLALNSVKSGGDFYIGYLTNGVNINCVFAPGRGFIGSADALTRMTTITGGTNNFSGFGVINPFFRVDLLGDLRIRGAGALRFRGTGSGDADVNLYGSAADTLKTDDAFESAVSIKGPVYILGTAALYTNANGVVLQDTGKTWQFYDTASSSITTINNLGQITGTSFSGALNATDLSSGTVAEARLATIDFSKVTANTNENNLTVRNLFPIGTLKDIQSFHESATYQIDYDGNRSQFLKPTNNTTVTIINAPASTSAAESLYVGITNGSLFSVAWTLPSNFRWVNGPPPLNPRWLDVNFTWNGYEGRARWDGPGNITIAQDTLSPAGGTNFVADMAIASSLIIATNDVFFLNSTNRVTDTAFARTKLISILASGANRRVDLQASWLLAGATTRPFTITNGTWAEISLRNRGPTETNIVASQSYAQ